jgi:hypothetical protein
MPSCRSYVRFRALGAGLHNTLPCERSANLMRFLPAIWVFCEGSACEALMNWRGVPKPGGHGERTQGFISGATRVTK